MKSGLSIVNPTADDLQTYGMSRHVEACEKPLWLGSPNMTYSLIFAALVTVSSSIIFVVYYRIKIGFGCHAFSVNIWFECGQYATEARAKIFFDLFPVVIFLFEIIFISSLKYISYLITDKHIYIFIENNWRAKLAYRTRMAVSKNGKPIFRYDWADLRRVEVRSSIINCNVGNIYLCNICGFNLQNQQQCRVMSGQDI